MIILDSYLDYKELLTDEYQPNLVYRGEDVIKSFLASLQDKMSAWIIWDNEKGLELCSAVKTEDAFVITKVIALTNFFQLCGVESYPIFKTEIQSWLNLCHYEDESGVIHYDSYYNRYPISDKSEEQQVSVGDLRDAVRRVVAESLPFEEGDTVILASRLSQSNLMKDALQRLGCDILCVKHNEMIDEKTAVSCVPLVYINLFEVNTQSMITVPMQNGQELAVYDVPTDKDAISIPSIMKLYKSYSDLFGNSWLSAMHADGSIDSRLYAEGKVDYCELNSK